MWWDIAFWTLLFLTIVFGAALCCILWAVVKFSQAFTRRR